MGDTSAGISAKYDDVVDYVELTMKLRRSLIDRYVMALARERFGVAYHVLRWLGAIRFVRFALRMQGIFTSTGALKTPGEAGLLRVATADEMARPEFAHVMSRYWVEDLAATCCQRFALDRETVDAMTEINSVRLAPRPGEKVRTFPRRFLLGAALVGTLFAAILNKESFEAVGWSAKAYGFFTLIAAGALIAITAYLGLFASLFADNRKVKERKPVFEFMPTVFVYCRAVCPDARSAGNLECHL
jgi:hypothetical protein